MKKFLAFFIIIISYTSNVNSMNKKPYHHLPDGTFKIGEVKKLKEIIKDR
jgi:N-acyl-phosphatidylethanolamine-hydrolysing phospholipase D|tara:strand:- start:447 stop:596 length:150 start_codon:yes stop_codon:yes gene_type:complete